MRRLALLAVVLGALVVFAGCQRERPASTPPPAPVAATVPSEGLEATPTAAAVLAVTTPFTPTAIVTATTPPTPTAVLEAVALQALRIRSGPGLEYPIVGELAATGRVLVIGRSADGAWLQIECPEGVAAQPCWIVGDPGFWQFDEVAAALPTAQASPPPAPSATPTAPPCVVAPPSGWVAASIAAGDTLSDLASRLGVSVSELQRINCLSSDAIVAGELLFVPGVAAAPQGSAGDASSSAAAPSTAPQAPLLAAAANSIVFKAPGLTTAGCRTRTVPSDPNQPLRVNTSGLEPTFRDTFVITDWVCIYVANLDPTELATVKLTRPGSEDLTPSAPAPGANAWSLLLAPGAGLLPGESSAPWTVDVLQGARRADPKQITINRAPTPTLRVTTRIVAPGEQVQTVAAGFAPHQRTALFLYRLDRTADGGQWMLERQLADMVSDANGEASYTATMRSQDAGSCFLLHTGAEDPQGANLYDPRVFAVGVSVETCQ